MKRAFLIMTGTLLFSTSLALGDLSYFRCDDPVGDQIGMTDVVRMDFSFDQATGAYTILLTADAAHPFQGDFRININIFNADTGTTNPTPSFFTDTGNDYYSVSPVSTFTLTGTNANLKSWDVGDQVATSSVPFGNPDSSSYFRSMVWELPFPSPGEDIIAYGDSAVIVPVPGAVLLGAVGLSVAGWRLRRSQT